MRLEEVLPAYRAGKKIRRGVWSRGLEAEQMVNYSLLDILAHDWEIAEEAPITITREQFERACMSMPMEKVWGVDQLWQELSK